MILECVYNSLNRNITTFVSKLLFNTYIHNIIHHREAKEQVMKCVLHFCSITQP